MLYTAYVAPVGRLIASYGVHFHVYADDTQLFTRLKAPVTVAISRLQDCVSGLQHWFWNNGLLLNRSKTAIVYFGTARRLKQSCLPPVIQVAGSDIKVSTSLQLLGVTLDSTLSFDQHINNIIKNCNYHLQALRHLRSSVTTEVANMLACSIIGSRIDYCNSLFAGMSDKNLNKLQRIQNRAARIVSGASSQHVSSTQRLQNLHWLPVRSRIDFKLATLCYCSRTLDQPHYLSALLLSHRPERLLRSSAQEFLSVPRCNTAFGDRRFSVAAPRVWNSLPLDLRLSESLPAFKKNLKTFLFRHNID